MKIGIITNLIHIDRFVKSEMAFADSKRWMSATGGNTGNTAFVEGVKKIVKADVVREVHWGDNPEQVNKAYDMLVICCANQIGAHVDLGTWADRLKAFDLPTMFIGLGAQSNSVGTHPEIPEGTKRLLALSKELRTDSSVSNIITRGAFTSEVIETCDVDSNPFGCPSQFISTELNVGQKCLEHQTSTKHFRILTAAGNPWHPSYVLEKTLVELVNQYQGDYVIQHPESLIKLCLNEGSTIDSKQQERLKTVYNSLGDWETLTSWFRSHGVLFADAQNWMHYSKRFSLAVGPRYHGVALPIQAGVPGKVIAIDSRTEELSSTTGIPFVRYKDVENSTPEELIEWCKWTQEDANNYDNIRLNNAKKYAQFFEQNKLSYNQSLKALSEQHIQ